MDTPHVKIGCVQNVFVRQMHFKQTGDLEHGHAHAYDHMTLLAKGKLLVKIDDDVTEYTAPTMIFIKAELEHELVAASDNTVAYCVHALRDENENIIDPDMVPKSDKLAELMSRLVLPKK